MIDAILLEFEDIVAETREFREVALAHALANEGIVVGDAELEAGRGLPVRASVAAACVCAGAERDDTALDLLALRAERRFAEVAGKGLSLVPGAMAFLEAIVARVPVAVVTRASRREVEFVLSLARLEHLASVVVASDDVRAPQPSPDGHAKALRRLASRGHRVAHGVALESAACGVRAARAAEGGLRVIAVGSLPAHEALLADAMIPSITHATVDSLAVLLSLPRQHAR